MLSLRFAGLGPYLEEQQIDFDRLEDLGVYLISGRTGAGKSSILDAVCFALYGSVPRFDGGSSRLRSDHCGPDDETFAELDFEAAGRVYRIRRSPEYERPAKRGGGITKQPAKASMLELVDGAWVGLSSSAREIGSDVARVVGLSREQFLQVVLLAQNRFHQFLLAKNDDRQKLLRTLFQTERFDVLRRRLLDEYKAAGSSVESHRTALVALVGEATRLRSDAGSDGSGDNGPADARADTVTDADADADDPDGIQAWLGSMLAEAIADERRSDDAAEAATAAVTAASTAHDAARLVAEKQERRARAMLLLDDVRAAEPTIVEHREAVEAAARADAVVPFFRASDEASARSAAAEADERAATARFEAVFSAAPPPAAPTDSVQRTELDAILAEIDETLGALKEALAAEGGLERARREAADARSELERLTTAVDAVDRDLDALPLQLAELAATIDGARDVAAVAESRQDAVDALSAAAEAAEALDAARRRHASQTEAYARASEAHRAAADRHAALVAARFAGFATELATALEPGESCPVCGSVEHPSPARHGVGRATSADDVAQALSAVEACADRLRLAADAERTSGERVAVLTVSTGGADAASIAVSLSSARAELIASQDARRLVASGMQQRDALASRSTTLSGRRATLAAEREKAVAAVARATASLETLVAGVDMHKSGFDSVSSRSEDLLRRRAAGVALADARAATSRRAAAATDAVGASERAVADRGFGSRGEVERAIMSSSEVSRLLGVISGHDRRRAEAEAVLREPGSESLPHEAVDVDAPAAELARSRDERDSILERRAAIADRRARIGRVVHAAETEISALRSTIDGYHELRDLAEAIDGRGQNTRRMDLEAFALAGRLEQIVEAANIRLATMTSRRYSLEHDDSVAYRGGASGLGLRIYDGFTGVGRQPSSLSGGETFLASLALALGLADVVTAQAGGVSLETMFIDEGFGSLDSETLETAMTTLDDLRAGGRTVGLISHVDMMKERIPIGLEVSVGAGGDSVIRSA